MCRWTFLYIDSTQGLKQQVHKPPNLYLVCIQVLVDDKDGCSLFMVGLWVESPAPLIKFALKLLYTSLWVSNNLLLV